ncbi:beta strand repeat-containing protein [Sphingosinicella soli]|uniref:Autotransporter-associated beta strand protein n=1 Tax=Sphingosinicella soli TaxID=333708 RepID=A0A7W7F7P6_9SPHN|nr:autotransporter-associated beta strand repeat-containing protein [Sphingosinicella soli]MBB4633681.1 autotransporter-associated beta strand protein [Sphingosinicella soli]
MSNATDRHRQYAAQVSRRLLSGSSLAALALLALAAPAHAEDRNWDANGTAIGTGGTGTWNLDNLNWSPSADGVSGPYSLPWSNAALDNAIFGGTAGTVTLGAPIVVHNLTFNAAGFTLTGSTLTLSGLSPTIATNSGNTTINSVIAGSSGLTKAGAGGLILNGTNSFTGDILLNLGSIYAGSDAALGNAENNISTAAAATVRLSIAGAPTNRTVTIGDAGTLILEGAGAGSALITGSGRVSAAASGVTMSNDASTYTGQTIFSGCNGVCSTRFTSIGDLGVASSLGAPVTVADGTIVFNQQSQYTDSLIYLGDGDSSNRNWDINGNGAIIRNQGTGTLTITGDVDVSAGGTFLAETANIELLGVLSGGNYAFNGAAGNVVTLGGANTFAGAASIGGLVRASVLADIGAVSSLGTGTNITLSAGSLSYTGTGNSSNRLWIANGAGGILNDGTGALNLSGSGTFAIGGAADSLTLGGTFAGENSFLGTISGAGNLIGNGAGTWVLGGANDFTGSVTVNAGTLKAGSSSAFGAATGFIVNGGTLDLDGYDLTAPSLSGTGGTVALGSANLTVDTATNVGYAGIITGGGGLTKAGNGILTLSGANTYTGTTTINGGTLALGFNSPGAPLTDIISSASTLNMAGGTVTVFGGAGQDNVQTFNGLNILAGNNRISAEASATGSVTVNLGAINRAGGLIDFALPATGNFTTSNTSLGGWATINGTDYAKVVGGAIVAFTEADYTDQDDASLWADGQYISDSDGDTESFSGTVASDVQLAGLQFTTADPTTTVTVAPTATLGIDGTIIVAPSVGANNQTIPGAL